jgi:hypothetical protein
MPTPSATPTAAGSKASRATLTERAPSRGGERPDHKAPLPLKRFASGERLFFRLGPPKLALAGGGALASMHPQTRALW